MRTLLIWLAAAFVFGNFYTMIAHKEGLRREGQTVYLKLAPVDPRSMMQGDYMALNYEVMNQVNHDGLEQPQKHPKSGALIIKIDPQNVGTFVRYDEGQPLAPGEYRLKYRRDGWRGSIGAESYFIAEGSGKSFAHATYGELKLEPNGTPLIVALCDKNRHRLSSETTKSSK